MDVKITTWTEAEEAAAAEEASVHDAMVRVHTAANRFEADYLAQALRQDMVPVLVRSFEDTAYDGLFIPQLGWGAIMVPRAYEARARAIIDEALAAANDHLGGDDTETGNP